MARSLGRKLHPYEHVHHLPGFPKDTTDLAGLEIKHDIDHGQHHYGQHFIRSSVGTLIWVGCKNDMTEAEIDAHELV